MRFEEKERKELENSLLEPLLESLKKMNIPEKYVNVRCNVDGFDDETRIHFKISLNLPNDIGHSLDLSHAETKKERKEIENSLSEQSLESLKKMNIPEKYINVRCNVDSFDDETRVHFKISLNLPDDIWRSLDLSHAETNNEAPNS